MKIISFLEARQPDVIRSILEHCGLWQEQPARGPPQPTLPLCQPESGAQPGEPDTHLKREPDPDFAEHLRLEQQEQPELSWDP